MSTESDSEDSSIDGPLDIHRDDGWQDVEPDVEVQYIICLFCPVANDDVSTFLSHCQQTHNFDFLHIREAFDLDFIGTVKLVNYLRSHGQSDRLINVDDLSKSMEFQDDRYLKPVLQDDVLLYSLDELPIRKPDVDGAPVSESSREHSTSQVGELQHQLEQMKIEFAEYKSRVDQSLSDAWDRTDSSSSTSLDNINPEHASSSHEQSSRKPSGLKGYEADYFDSYSYNSIHETMLKDTVRTDAYRDFIYDNKHLFANKVVLDVGCGTGILSMFAARAGAKQVIAVDNSSILEKAHENVFENNLQDTIKCLRGKIEEIHLPVPQVDIIISEWMGYCLLYEAMLDSVLWARDRYLAPGGLMVPSHASLRIAPVADDDLVASHLDFWKDVYGFSMNSMRRHTTEDILIRTMPEETIIGAPDVFLSLDLRICSTSDLSFTAAPFSSTISVPSATLMSDPTILLAGFVISFDIFFLPFPPSTGKPTKSVLSALFTVSTFNQQGSGHVAFTTGPQGPPTHWQQGVLLLKEPKQVNPGKLLKGTVGYEKRQGEARGLDVRVRWNLADANDGEGKEEEEEADVEKGGKGTGGNGKRKGEKEQVWSL